MWHIYTMEYYPAIKKNEIMSFAGKWMELEVIMFSETSQTQKDKYPVFCHMQNSDLKPTATKDINVKGRVWGRVTSRRGKPKGEGDGARGGSEYDPSTL
jgi:hypothetical protein